MYSTCEGCFPAAHGHFSLGQVDKNIDGYVSSPLLSALNPGAHPTLPALPHDCSPHCRVCCVQARTAVVQQAPLSSAIWHYYVTNRTAGEITKIYQASLVPSCVHWCGVNTESDEGKQKWKSSISLELRRCNYLEQTVVQTGDRADYGGSEEQSQNKATILWRESWPCCGPPCFFTTT